MSDAKPKKYFEVELKIRMLVPWHNDDDENARFHFEENHCVGNLIDQLAEEKTTHTREDGVAYCVHCSRAEVTILRPVPLDDLKTIEELTGSNVGVPS